jgi:hypothetical protein
VDESYIFHNYAAIFPQWRRHFQHILPTLSNKLHTIVVKFPASNSEHITSGTMRQASIEFVPPEIRKTSFSITKIPCLAHARGNRKKGMNSPSPSCSQPRSGTVPLPPVWVCTKCTVFIHFYRWQRTETKFLTSSTAICQCVCNSLLESPIQNLYAACFITN